MQMTGRWLGMVGLSLAAFLFSAAPLAAQAQKPTTPGYPVTPGYGQAPGYPQAPVVQGYYGVATPEAAGLIAKARPPGTPSN